MTSTMASVRRHHSRAARAGLLLGAGLLLATGRAGGVDPAAEVHISQFRFAPRELTVPRGAAVRWVNDDDEPHTVTSDGGAFASSGLDTHEQFTFTFDAAGAYPYHCALHPTMTGRVVVK
jgi:plastocyanin